MLRISQNVKYRQSLHVPALCRFLSNQTSNQIKALVDTDSDVCIISRSTLKNKKSKNAKKHIPSRPSLSQRLRDSTIRKELSEGNWVALPENVSYKSTKKKNHRIIFCNSSLTLFLLHLGVPPPNKVKVATLAHGLEKVLFK